MALRFLTAGESHGPELTAILDGMAAGFRLAEEQINMELLRRQQGFGGGPRMKIEQDTVRILGGVMDGVTTGAPLGFAIANRDHERWRGRAVEAFTRPRPGHADLTGAIKYGFHDLRPALERASARETAARVAVGAVCKVFLAQFGIRIGGYVISIGEIEPDLSALTHEERFELAETSEVRCPDPAASEAIRERIRRVMTEKDTLGGVVEVVALGLPPGLGSYVQWDRRLESRLGAAMLSVQAMKGVEFGPAFENSRLPGTRVHDPIRIRNGNLVRPTDRAGGLEGGITTGEPLVMRVAMKPIATTLHPQATVDLASGEEVPTQYERSDFCPTPRAVPILEAMAAFVLADALIEKIGGDSIAEMLPRFDRLRRARLADLPMDGAAHVFWPEKTDFEGE